MESETTVAGVMLSNELRPIELSELENNLLKAAFMALLGFRDQNSTMLMAGVAAGQEILKALDDESLEAFGKRMDAHAATYRPTEIIIVPDTEVVQ